MQGRQIHKKRNNNQINQGRVIRYFCSRASPKVATCHAVNCVQLTVGDVERIADRSQHICRRRV